MTKNNMIGLARENYYRSVGSKIAIIFGLSMLIYCILVIYQRFKSQLFDGVFFMTILTLVLSIYILLNKNRNILSTMGLYCLGMALTRLPLAFMYIFFPNPAYAFFIGIFFLVIAVNMLYSAWEYLHGICRGYISGTVLISFLWLVYAGLLIATIAGLMPDVEGTVFERVMSPAILVANVILFMAYLLVLGTDEIHDSCELEIAHEHLQTFRSTFDAGFDSSVSREDARKIFSGPAGWEKKDNGPVEAELRFIISYTDKVLFGIAQKWKGDDRKFFTISENVWDGTMIEATRFIADEITADTGDVENCTHLIFRRKNGDSFSIEVLDDNIEVIM